MKVQGLDGRWYAWSLPRADEREVRSSHHLRAGELLRSIYPLERLLEEIFLPGCFAPLYVDFAILRRKLLVEVHGPQHYRFIAHFHGNLSGWHEQQQRDQRKREFAIRNELTLIELPHDEDNDAWRHRLLGPTAG